nr:condensin complex subunit [Farysia itapuensis]
MPPRGARAAASAAKARHSTESAASSSSSSSAQASAAKRAGKSARASAKPSSSARSRKRIVESEEEEEEDDSDDDEMHSAEEQDDSEEEERLPSKTSRKSAAAPAQRNARTSRAKPAPAPAKRRGKKLIESDEEQDEVKAASDDEDLDDSPSVARTAHLPTAKLTAEADESDDSDASETFVDQANDNATAQPLSDKTNTVPVPETPSAALLKQLSSPSKPHAIATPAGPLKRLVIHKMVLNDFKSYAGRQEIGPFHKSFSSVVGPNGSGKSNVIDSLLFVFGWRATKMRQGKLSELIHNSAGKENLPHCSVEVWFREIVDLPGDGFRVVPGSKLIVSRTAYRNNTSQYFINARKSTFTECTTLLKAKGIDLDHKRFLILQGEVESIAQMPPKAKNEHEEGLLEYLEDIVGTSCYKTPIEEQAKLVDEANERRAEKLGRLKIVQKEKDALESKKRQAEEFLRDQNELSQRQSALWQVYLLECKDQMKVAANAIESLQARMAEETEKHSGSKAEIDALEQEYKTFVKDFEAIAKSTEKVAKELAKYEKDDVQLQEKRKHLESRKKKLSKSLGDDKHALSEAKSTATNSTETIEKVTAELSKLEASLDREEAELEKIRDSLKGKTEIFSRAIEQKQKELQPWTSKISEKTAARDVAQEERQLLASRSEQVEAGIAEAKQALEDLELDNRSKHDEVQSLKQERKDLDKKVKTCQIQLTEMKEQESSLRNKFASARSKAEDAKSAASASRSQGDVLSSLSRQAELGMIKGFHGRLGNLGVIDDKYDVAISTACPGLNNIVVDSVDCGQACIEHLRKNNLGRANFVLLNSLGINESALAPIQTPENVPRLFDLIKPRDARFAAAFYHQLRDTLVANDLAHANRIAYSAKRWRVVTLDGQLIDKSGTMSGGGNKVSRGAMNSKFSADDVSPEQLKRMERDRDSAEEMLRGHLTSIKTVESLLEGHRAREPQIEVTLDKIQMDLESGQQRMAEAKKRVAELKAQSKPDAADASRIQELDTIIAGLDKDISKLSEKAQVIEKDIAELQEKILEAGGVALRTQKSKVDGIKEMMDLSSERITKAQVAQSKAEKDIVKFEKSLSKAQEQQEGLDQELDELKAEIEQKASAVDSVRRKMEEAQHIMDAKAEERDEIKSQLDEHSESANSFRALEMEIKQKLDDNQRSHSDNEKRLKHWQDKLATLVLHQIDDEEEEPEAAQTSTGDVQADAASSVPKPAADKVQEKEDEDLPLELPEYPDDELRAIDKETIKGEIVFYEEKVAKGSANMSVLAEYRRREQEFLARAKDLESTTEERDAAKNKYDDLRKQRLENFMAGFSVISSKLKEMYQTITLGGNAELELVDSLDPFSEGILFSVMPPKKSWKNISNLSGGEKTLSSLALVFALHAYKPTPVYVMDEIDAALDFRNVSIVANLIRERTKGGQFIIISLRNNMFELSSRLIGVYKTANCTKSITIDNTSLFQQAAPATIPPSATKARMGGAGMPGSPVASQSTMVAATPRPMASSASFLPKTSSMMAPSLLLRTPALNKGLKTPSTALQRSRMASAISSNFLADKAKGRASLLATPTPASFRPTLAGSQE